MQIRLPRFLRSYSPAQYLTMRDTSLQSQPEDTTIHPEHESIYQGHVSAEQKRKLDVTRQDSQRLPHGLIALPHPATRPHALSDLPHSSCRTSAPGPMAEINPTTAS
eukprot:68143-Hanusia_phi.AAC.2